MTSSCCHHEPENHGACHPGDKPDYMLYGSVAIIVTAIAAHYLMPDTSYMHYLHHFGGALVNLLGAMWWGILLGIVAVGFMQRVPRAYFNALLGRGDTFGGLLRACAAGLVLDLCSHGILMVGAKLYERGASLAQVITFLIASPWNSITLTLILVSLVGLPWTLVFIAGSAVIALVTGVLYLILTKKGILPENPNIYVPEADFDLRADMRARLKAFRPTPRFFAETVVEGFREGKMVMRWLFFGTIIAALIQAFVSTDTLTTYFGPTLLGLCLTLLATTIIEVCSEGSTPIGAELVTRAAAPGNGFAFLMAGVATDYTEILVIREFTKSWKVALSLPVLTVPQVLLLGWIMNQFGGG